METKVEGGPDAEVPPAPTAAAAPAEAAAPEAGSAGAGRLMAPFYCPERRRRGRPSTFDWTAIRLFAVAVGMTGSMREAEKLCRVSRRQVQRWRTYDERCDDLINLAWLVADSPQHPERGWLTRHQSTLWWLLDLDPDDPRFHAAIRKAREEVLRGA